MKKTETREVIVTYCDYCGTELKYGHSSIKYPDGTELDFCNEYTDQIIETCLDKYKKENNNPKQAK